MSALADYHHPASVRRVLASLAEVVCPPEAFEHDVVDDIVDHVELSMRASPAPVRAGLVAGLLAYELGAAAWPAHIGRRASRLPLPAHRRYFARWWHSRLGAQRQFARGVKGLLCLACYEQPALQERLGYRPTGWIEEVSRRRLAVHGDAARRHQAALLEPDPLPRRPLADQAGAR